MTLNETGAPMRKFLMIAVALAALLPAAHAEDRYDEDKRGAIRELLDVTQADRRIRGLAEEVQMRSKQEAPLLLERALIANKALSDKQKQAVADKLRKNGAVQRLVDQAGKVFTTDAFRNDALNAHYDAYGRFYTTQELKELVAFYKSATGQKFLATQGKVEQDIIGGLMQKYLPQSGKATFDAAEKEVGAAAK